MTYTTGDNVKRREARPQVAAVVVAVLAVPDGQLLELAYQEGGHGWWPADAVVSADA